MRKTALTAICALMAIAFSNVVCESQDRGLTEKAEALLADAASDLARLGGFGATEAAVELGRLPEYSGLYLTPEQIKEFAQHAIDKTKKAIELDPTLKRAYHYLGVAYMLAGESDSAIQLFKIANKLEPRRENTYVYLCLLFWNGKRFDEARNAVNKYIRNFPDKTATGLILDGNTCFHQHDYRNAIKRGTQLIALDDKHTGGLYLLAQSYNRIGDTIRAKNIYKKIAEIEQQRIAANQMNDNYKITKLDIETKDLIFTFAAE